MTDQELGQYLAKLPGPFPVPQAWSELYELLPLDKDGRRAPLPLILGAYGEPDEAKAARFREHLQWADENQGLPMVVVYLMTLPEDAWEKQVNEQE
jgi:hypothetical protein